MNCIGPMTPEDFELLAYADGEASSEVTGHISACARCRTRAEELREELSIWQNALRGADCPSPLKLGEHAFRLLPAAQAVEVGRHLRHCRSCASELAMLIEFMSRVEDSRLHLGVAEAAGRLRSIKARLAGASLDFGEGFAAPRPRAVREQRGPYLGATAPVTYNAEEFLITLEFWPEDGAQTRQLVGLVVGPDDFAGALVEVTGAGEPQSARVDELGSFSVTGVPVGAHRLLVRLPTTGLQVEIDELNVN